MDLVRAGAPADVVQDFGCTGTEGLPLDRIIRLHARAGSRARHSIAESVMCRAGKQAVSSGVRERAAKKMLSVPALTEEGARKQPREALTANGATCAIHSTRDVCAAVLAQGVRVDISVH